MSKLIVSNIMSLDGYTAAEDRGIPEEVLPLDEAFYAYNAEQLHAAGTMLLGKTTYRMLEDYWPPVFEDPTKPPVEQEVSRLCNAIDKLVISDSLEIAGSSPWHSTTTVVKRVNAHAHITKLKHGEGKNIFLPGSPTVWNDLLAQGLVDELHMIVSPVILGEGLPAFRSKQAATLTHTGTRTYGNSGNTVLYFQVRY